jgi:hypothetical protein
MRLPQSRRNSLFTRVFSALFLVLIGATVPLHARTPGQLRSSPVNLRFASAAVAQTETESVTLTNTGKSSTTISAITVNHSGFSLSGLHLPVVVAPGASTKLNVTFAPSKSGWVGAEISVTSNASNSILQIGIHANAVSSDPLAAAPSSLSFGQVTIGSNSMLPVVLTNIGTATETLTAFQMTGTGFSVSGPSLPLNLAGGQSATLNVTFTPKTSGVASGSVFVPGPSLTVPLTGTGTTSVGQLTVAPSTLGFGNVNIGSTNTLPSTITASGGSVTVSSASSSNSQFAISGSSFPMTLSSGQSAQVSVVYAPTATGAASATLTFTTSTSTKSSEALSGSGVSATNSVSLSWSPSTSSVVGYNVYRGTTVGAYTKLNSALNATTSYTDTTVASGTTYYYAATSVNSAGQESSYSSPLQVSVP